jgi:hypothetical protein
MHSGWRFGRFMRIGDIYEDGPHVIRFTYRPFELVRRIMNGVSLGVIH